MWRCVCGNRCPKCSAIMVERNVCATRHCSILCCMIWYHTREERASGIRAWGFIWVLDERCDNCLVLQMHIPDARPITIVPLVLCLTTDFCVGLHCLLMPAHHLLEWICLYDIVTRLGFCLFMWAFICLLEFPVDGNGAYFQILSLCKDIRLCTLS